MGFLLPSSVTISCAKCTPPQTVLCQIILNAVWKTDKDWLDGDLDYCCAEVIKKRCSRLTAVKVYFRSIGKGPSKKAHLTWILKNDYVSWVTVPQSDKAILGN